MIWKRYYWRVVGYFLAFGGFGLIVDELIEGPFNLLEPGHELWGLILIVIGLICISIKPKDKVKINA